MSPAHEPIPTIIRDLNARLEAERLTLADELLADARGTQTEDGEPGHSTAGLLRGTPADAVEPALKPFVGRSTGAPRPRR